MKTITKGAAALLAGAAIFGFAGMAAAQTAEVDAAYEAAIDMLPPGAKPGECYARVYIGAQTKKVAKQVLVKEETEKLEVVPAQYEFVDETVEIASEAEELELVPAKYETRDKVIVVEPEREEKEVVPAVFETVEERVKIRDAYTTWKKGEGPIQRYDEATGEIMCLVTIPAEYETVEKRIVKSPPRVVTKTIPAKTETVQVRVMVEPPQAKTIKIPAKFESVSVRKLVEPAKVTKIKIPAVFETVYEEVKATEGKMEWRPILCNTNASEDLIKRLQLALNREGYSVGTVDGVLGRGTMDALKRYQRAKGLAEGQVTIEALNELNVSVN